MRRIDRVTVLGAGVMGSQIAAHLANAGVPVRLLDITPEAAREGLEKARKMSPNPFFTPERARFITTGSFDERLPEIGDSDWIVEAVVERLDIKQSLLEKVDRFRAPESIVSSNTSGIPIGVIATGRSESFRRHWLGTHFFNPPRYLRLLEVIPTPETDPAVTQAIAEFADHRLGKGVVIAKDTPNFIGNHIAMYGVLRTFDALGRGYTVEEIDAISGPATGRPKSATFRTLDIAGIDVVGHVLRNTGSGPEMVTPPALGSGPKIAASRQVRPDPRARAVTDSGPDPHGGVVTDSGPDPTFPSWLREMLKRGWIGEKAGQGFYKKVKQPDGSAEILALDIQTLEYRPQRKPKLPSLEAAKSIENVGERIRTLFLGKDRVGEFLRDVVGSTLVYTARVAPGIAHSIDDVDRAMRWGFAWELGPFETWDAIGVREVLQACGIAEADAPPIVREVLARGANTFRPNGAEVPPAGPGLQILRAAKERSRVVKKNAGASLVDLGDDVLCVEFHSKMNAIGGDTIQMIEAGVKEAARNYRAIVVGNDAPNFSAGANLMLLLLEAQEGNWDEVDLAVRAFQRATSALRFSPVPVVVAPAGLTLGGGCEMVLHGDRAQAAAETYVGLVEVGVGLIPGGGGTKEMLARAMDEAPPVISDYLPFVQPVFEAIGFAKVATSAGEARQNGVLRDVDRVTMNRERLIADAKTFALERAAEGYVAPLPRTNIRVGGEGVLAALKLGVHLAWRAGRISDHDKKIGEKLAWILAGGSLPHPTMVSEQYLLDLEREVFVSLAGEPKTQERIAHTLKTGKPLRN